MSVHLDAVTAPVIALVLLAISRAPIGWVPMDADGSPRTPTGRWHNVLAALAFASATVGAFVVGVPLSASGNETAARACGLVGWFMTAASAVTIPALSVRALRPALGPAERLIYVGMFSWMTIAGIDLLTR